MSDDKTNGATPPEPVEMTIHQLVAMRIKPFALHLADEDLLKLADMLIKEEEQLGVQVLPQILAPSERPFWYFELQNPQAKQGVQVQTLKNLKDLKDVPQKDKIQMLIHHAFMLALLTDGLTARGVLRAHGFSYGFGELAQKVVAPKIVLVK